MPLNKTSTALYLHPRTPEWSIDYNNLYTILGSIGLIENSIHYLENSYYVGEKFLQHILFMGCSPAIKFKPTDDDTDGFCYVRLLLCNKVTLISTNKLSRPPHCPKCNKPFKLWHDLDITKQWRCTNCEKTSPPHEYNWKRSAGLARVFIEITDIYPKEAIPQSSLLEYLYTNTGVEWDYFYYSA